MSFPPLYVRFVTFAVFLFSSLAAQTPAFAPRVSLSKRTTLQQTGTSSVVDLGSLAVARVSFEFNEAPPEPIIQLRGQDITLDLVKIDAYAYEYRRPFDDRATMDRTIPDGSYTLVTSRGSVVVNVAISGALADARVTNWEALQRWNGRDNITAVVAPTPNLPFENAVLSVAAGGSEFMSGMAPVTTPSTSVTASGSEFRLPVTGPGDVVDGEVAIGTVRSVNPANTSLTDFRRVVVIKFPIARPHAAPQITSHPVGITVSAGASARLSVTASGSGLGYLWLKDGTPITGATNASLVMAAAQPSDTGNYTVIVSNSGGSAISNAARLVVNPTVAGPVIVSGPVGASVSAGASHTLTVSATGTAPLTYQWFRDGAPVAGATGSSLAFASTRPTDAGSYTVMVSNASGTITSPAAIVTVIPITRISNLSIRTRVGGDNGALTVGITVAGSETMAVKPLLIRAVGPTLAAFGVEGSLDDPHIALMSGSNIIAENDDWSGSRTIRDAATSVGAFALAADSSKDSALLPAPVAGGYTMRVTSKTNASGIALAEVYDATADEDFVMSSPRLTNVSALAQVGTGGDILIAGFSITGSARKTLLVRGVGPTLAAFGVAGSMADPKLEIYTSGSTTPLATNDNWGAATNASELASVSATVGAFALVGGMDSALLISLPPGSYSAQVSGVGSGATGMALVEVYEVR